MRINMSLSLNHEGVIALVRERPAFAASLLRDLLHVEVPHFIEARLTEAALNQLVPVEYYADAVVLFVDFIDNKNKPVLGTIFEVQLQPDARKLFTWPLYAVAARARYECPFVVTIVQALSEAARKALQMEPQIEKFFSEAHRRSYDRGKAEGEAEGEAKGEAKGKAEALLMFMKRRGLAITDDQEHRIVTCTDLAIIDRWWDRAFSVASVEELLA